MPRWLGPVVFGLAAAVLFVLFRGQLVLPHDNDAPLFTTIKDMRVFVEDNRNAIPILVPIRTFVGSLFLAIQGTLHTLSWPGLTAIAAALGLVIGGWRYAALGAVAIVSFGALGLWEPSVDTLALTFTAVAVALLIGIPVGILAGKSDRFYRFIMPILDLMQIMPTFAYLAPFALFFLIGPATAAILTLIYATPPAIRITALAIRAVPRTTVEAATSLGSTGRQILAKVELPMARRVIDSRGQPDLHDGPVDGRHHRPGRCAGSRQEHPSRARAGGRRRRLQRRSRDRDHGHPVRSVHEPGQRGRGSEPRRPDCRERTAVRVSGDCIALALSVVGIVAGAVLLAGADFPEVISLSFADPVNALSQWLRTNATGLTGALKDAVTYPLINPIQAVLTSAPWPLVVVVAVALALWVSGPGPALVTVVCLLGIIGLQLWEHSMVTLTTVLVATVLTLGLGVLIGILSARSNRLSQILRPFLDAAQTMPAFVYLHPRGRPVRSHAVHGHRRGRGLRDPARHPARRGGHSQRAGDGR